MGKDKLSFSPSIVLLLLFFFPGDISATTEPQYMVLVPFLIHTEVSNEVCIQLSYLNETVTLSATLEHTGENKSLIEDVVAEKDLFKCISFKLPRLNRTAVAFLSVLVEGPTLKYQSRKSVLVMDPENLVFVQTDKPIYKPGQKVLFRIVCLDSNLHPLNKKFPLVYIQDPQRNRVYQWQGVELMGGLIQLSFPLTSEPIQGQYKVVVQKESLEKVEHVFSVEEYVLPKFEVLVKLPKVITINDEELQVSVCGLYTYGKPVLGTVNVRVCRKFSSPTSHCSGKQENALCEEFTQPADVHGCVSNVIRTKIFQLHRRGYHMNIEVQGKITEEGTGVELTGTGSCEITHVMSKIRFEYVDSHYRPGIFFYGKVKMVDGSNAPLANETLKLYVTGDKNDRNYTTDEQGNVWFSIDTTNFTALSITIRARHGSEEYCYDSNWVTPEYGTASHTATRFYSPSKSFLKIEPQPEVLPCDSDLEVRVHYILTPEAVGEEKEITFYYLVMSKGDIVKTGTITQPAISENYFKKLTLMLHVGPEIAPLVQILVYTTVPSGEVIANSADFRVENCLPNKVSLVFKPPRGVPASSTELTLGASPKSLCAVRAVDKSVLLMKPEAELSASSVYSLLPLKKLNGYGYKNHYLEEEDTNLCVSLDPILLNGFIYQPMSPDGEGDAYSILKDLGLKVFTSTKVHKPEICRHYNVVSAGISYGPRPAGSSPPVFQEASLPTSISSPTEPMTSRSQYSEAPEYGRLLHSDMKLDDDVHLSFEETVRKYFPETWIWDLIPVDSQGEAALTLTIPDTITEWKASAFCTSEDSGFGLSPTVSLTAFQPFFLEITLPYSVVRGEAFPLKATVFNYLPHCIRVSVSLAPSSAFSAVPVEKEEDSYCLCENERKTVSWTVTPESLGEVEISVSAAALNSDLPCGGKVVEALTNWRKDTVIRNLLVEPEGVPRETTYNSLLCAAEGSAPSSVSLELPQNVVPDSARASFSVLGDILGTAMQNLHQLLQLPFGCGEQNMVLFAPNIYILQYLNKTGQLNEEIKSKAVGYLVSGYQRQLIYKHSDGSYSTFGPHSGQQGNTWLTAFVLKSFAQAQPHIYIDIKHIQDAQLWLSSKQKENGCFRSSGMLLNNAIKGGVDDEVTLSAYITIALLEIPLPISHPIVRNALFCLETAAQQEGNHVYTKALLAYAFALAGKVEMERALLDSLKKDAVVEDGSIHWKRPEKEPETVLPYYHPRAPSAEVEMTAYVLLAYLTTQPAPSQEDLTTASLIVKWLSKQQNPNGGFSSTQDTVVALQALALYGGLTYAKDDGATTVTLETEKGVQHQFHVDHANRLLLQRMTLPEVPGKYSMAVTGDGCVYTQTSLRYNVYPKPEEAPFQLHVHTIPETCDSPKAQRTFDIAINVSYTGKRLSSNMAIVDVKMLSGFAPLKASVKQLPRLFPRIKRTDLTANHVLVYLEKLDNVTLSFFFAVEREIQVQHLKQAQVEVYDYYEEDEFAVAEYEAPCYTVKAQQSNV